MIDLHIHSTNSDGEYSVKEILEIAEKKGINTISFCDHNVLCAYEELENMNIKKYYKGKIITGIEFNFVYDKKIFHILGYNFNVDILKKSKYIDKRKDEEIIKIQKQYLDFFKNVCTSLKIKLSPNLKISYSNECANDIIKNDMLKHKENDKILDDILGKDRKISFWRGHVTNPESPFYIDFTKGLPTAIEIADEIHKAGGIVVLPHLFEYKSIDNVRFLNEMYKLNILDGIECIHSKHNAKQARFLINFCKQHDLLMSGGSDFHTDKKQTLGHTELGEILDMFCLKK